MSRTHLLTFAALVATTVLAFMASATSAGTVQSQRASAAATTQQVGTVSVRFTIKRFVRRGHRLYAVGRTYAKFTPSPERSDLPTTVVSKAFTARVRSMRGFASAQRICPVLELTLGPVDLNLLGLLVHLDTVHLVITADSNGGLLGRLFCALGGHRPAHKLTKIAHRSGLATRGMRITVPLYQTGSGSLTTQRGSSPMHICPILDLTLGPLDLNLLGLLVHLDQVHLTIMADPDQGILGQLLHDLLCGPDGARQTRRT
jgi:hypothetical protein